MQITITIEKAFTISGLPENLTTEELELIVQDFGMSITSDTDITMIADANGTPSPNAEIIESEELALNWAITTEERESNV